MRRLSCELCRGDFQHGLLAGFKQRVLCDSLATGKSDRAASRSPRTPQLVRPRLIGGVDSTFLRFSLAAVVD